MCIQTTREAEGRVELAASCETVAGAMEEEDLAVAVVEVMAMAAAEVMAVVGSLDCKVRTSGHLDHQP